MPLLVDVVNVLHVTGVLPPELAGPDETALAELVIRSRWRRDWVRLVSDGGIPGERIPFSGHDVVLRMTGSRSADDVIVELAERSSFARRITVVSNDRAVIDRTKRFGCRPMSGERFLEHLAFDVRRVRRSSGDASSRTAPRPANNEPLSPESVEAWMREFGFGHSSSKE